MLKLSQKVIAFCLGLFLCAGLLVLTDAPSPAWAASRLTVTVSGNVSQAILDDYIEQITDRYGIDADDVYITYQNGTTVNCNAGTPAKAPAPAPKAAPAPVAKAAPAPEPAPQVAPAPQASPAPTQSSVSMTADEQKMFNSVNQERAKVGLPALKANGELLKLARLKAQDMINKGYFDHTSPTYGSPFDMMKAAGVSYRYAGENLAGAPTVDTAHINLMNSPGHRANILNANFKEVGIGIINGGPYGKMYVQMFIG